MLWALVGRVHPPGQVVLINDGSLAVCWRPIRDPARPHLQVIVNIIGQRVPQEEGAEFRPLPPTMNVVRVASEVPPCWTPKRRSGLPASLPATPAWHRGTRRVLISVGRTRDSVGLPLLNTNRRCPPDTGCAPLASPTRTTPS
jgi:hypothetical protein